MWQWLVAIATLMGALAGGGATPHQPAPEVARRFWVADQHRYASPWFAGRHRVMIGFGCTRAPYYDPSAACPHGEGFHHGVDVAMPCGTWLFAGVAGRVAPAGGPGAPGPSYGPHAFRIRTPGGVDVLLGHVDQVYVGPGDVVRRGQVVARANRLGAPDGCHLHLEVRPAGGGYTTAVDPSRYLRLIR